MDGSQFNPRQLNPFASGFAQQNTEMPVGQQADDSSRQASFEQQLSQLQPPSSEEGGGGIQSAGLRDNPFSGPEAAQGPGPWRNSGRQQPEFAVNKEVRVGAKRERFGPFAEDKELVSTFKKAAREAQTHERTVKRLVGDLHHLSGWLFQENRGPITGRFDRDSPGHASFVADVRDYLKDGGRFAVVAQLNKVAPGSLPSRDQLIGELPAEDADLLARFRVGAEQRNAAKGDIKNSLSRFRVFARWLQANDRDPLASLLRGGSLDNEISEYRSLGGDPQNRLKCALANLPRLLPGGEEAEAPGSEPRGIGRPRHLAPYPEDGPLIDGALGQALNDLRNPTAAQRQFAQKRATRLRALSEWLQKTGRGGSIAGRLNGSNNEQLTLRNDVEAFKLTGSRVHAPDLSHLGSYLKLVEANQGLGLQSHEQSALPAAQTARQTGALKELASLPATPSEGARAFWSQAMQEPPSSSTAMAPSDVFREVAGRDDAHFAPAHSARARSDTYGGLESIVDLNAPTPSELRDDAHFAPAHSAKARSDTYGGLESIVDLNAPTPSELRDDAHFAPAHSAKARSDTYGGLESIVDLNAPTPSELRDDAHFAHSAKARSDTYGGLESIVDLNAPTPSELRDDAHFAHSAKARSDTYGGLESIVDLNAPTPSELRDDAHFAPAHSAKARSDTYGGLPLVDLTRPTPSGLRDEVNSVRAFSTTSSDAQIGALDPKASSHDRGLVLGDTQWLGDRHILTDYQLLAQELQGTNPSLAARTRFVDPLVAFQLNWGDTLSTFHSIVHNRQGNDTADFLFLPVNNAHVSDPNQRGSHWSLLFVDRSDRQKPVAYHYDSAQGYNARPAEQLAGRLGARLESPLMAQQQNSYDCGVFVVDGMRELVRRLAQGGHSIHLDQLVADRQALQNRLRS
ncbi:Ulp1 family isopeptidase [Mesorhizobium sophorae]|uniref:Ulp1 family isopeptidase n=1 Tax=Mesorhizobium sophorae TaxID=1300294 RepID=UPI001FD9444D|nr:Ulp1 family isopeptidase [Mesorhizobium sophorae]